MSFSGLHMLPLGYQQLGSGALAVATAPTVVSGADAALIGAETQGIRFRDDGTAPTATSGFLLTSGTVYEYIGNLSKLSIIAATGGAVCNILYYKVAG